MSNINYLLSIMLEEDYISEVYEKKRELRDSLLDKKRFKDDDFRAPTVHHSPSDFSDAEKTMQPKLKLYGQKNSLFDKKRFKDDDFRAPTVHHSPSDFPDAEKTMHFKLINKISDSGKTADSTNLFQHLRDSIVDHPIKSAAIGAGALAAGYLGKKILGKK